MLISAVTTVSTAPHSIQYHDCRNPQNVKQYSLETSCRSLVPTPGATTVYQILQEPKVSRIKGTKCTIHRSTFYYSCGAWGHLKTATVPQILHTVQVSAEWCRSLSHSREFTPPGSTEKFTLSPDTTNVIRVETTGKIVLKEQAVACQGEPGRIEGNIMPSILELDEYHVSVMEESYLLHEGQVESLSDHLRLPANCLSTQTYCETSRGTYVWSLPGPRCNLELVSKFEPRQEGSLLIDEQNKILINVTRRAVMPACGLREIYHTELDGILVLKGADPILGVPNIDPGDIRTDTFVTSVSAYVMYSAENKIALISSSWRHQICRDRWSHRSNEPQRIAPDLWGMRRGDILYTFSCPVKTADISEADKCYDDIPIVSDPPLYVDPVSRLVRPFSAVVPCSKRLPMMIKTTVGWVELSPHLRRATPPRESFPVEDSVAGFLPTTSTSLSTRGSRTWTRGRD